MAAGTDIRYDASSTIRCSGSKPPEGYAVEVKHRAHVTEKEMIDYLGILADFNDKTFPDEAFTSWKLLRQDQTVRRQKPRKDRPRPSESSWTRTCTTVGVSEQR